MVKSKKGSTKNIFQRIAVYNRLIFGLLFFVGVGAAIYLNYQGMISPNEIILYLQEHKTTAPLIFVALYVLMVVCMLPTLPLNLGAGFLWGAWWGMLYSVIGASAGALAAFLISRYLMHDFFNTKFKHSAWIWMQKEAEQRDWKLVAFTRINPIFPFGPTNYFYGITRIPLKKYLFGTVLFITPPSLIVATMGALINDIMANAQAKVYSENILLVGVGVTLLAILKMVVSNRSGKKLKKQKHRAKH